MANKKVTALTELTTPASDDLLYVVDLSDTSGGADGTSKKLQIGNLSSSGGGADKWRIFGSSNVGTTSSRLIGIRGNYVDVGSANIYTQAMMPENCELVSLTCSIAVTDDCQFTVQKNGSTLVYTTGTVAFTANTAQTFSPTGTSISQGDLINIEVTGAANPGDVHLVMTFQAT